jgi:K+-sensing histidine kinase KdpD
MIKPDPHRWPKPHTIVYYVMAVLSVAMAIAVAEFISRQLHAEAIASSMLCAVIFAAWFGGFGPALVAIALALLAFHYYLVPPGNSFAWKHDIFAFEAAASGAVFNYVSRCFLHGFVAAENDGSAPTFRQ